MKALRKVRERDQRGRGRWDFTCEQADKDPEEGTSGLRDQHTWGLRWEQAQHVQGGARRSVLAIQV